MNKNKNLFACVETALSRGKKSIATFSLFFSLICSELAFTWHSLSSLGFQNFCKTATSQNWCDQKTLNHMPQIVFLLESIGRPFVQKTLEKFSNTSGSLSIMIYHKIHWNTVDVISSVFRGEEGCRE